MLQIEPLSDTELEIVLAECLLIFARRGREIRQAAQKQTTDTEKKEDDKEREDDGTIAIDLDTERDLL